MSEHDTTTTTTRRRLAAMRRAGYNGPAYLRGRPAYDFAMSRRSPASV